MEIDGALRSKRVATNKRLDRIDQFEVEDTKGRRQRLNVLQMIMWIDGSTEVTKNGRLEWRLANGTELDRVDDNTFKADNGEIYKRV